MADERVEILKEGIELTTQSRNKVYGSFHRNMQELNELIDIYAKNAKTKYYGAHDAAMVMALTKISRIMCGGFHRDNYVDAAVYLAAAYECESNDRTQHTEEPQAEQGMDVPKSQTPKK